MEEADMRLAETKKESYEFDRDIVKGSVNNRTAKVIAEKVLRYFDDRLRARVRKVLIIVRVATNPCFRIRSE